MGLQNQAIFYCSTNLLKMIRESCIRKFEQEIFLLGLRVTVNLNELKGEIDIARTQVFAFRSCSIPLDKSAMRALSGSGTRDKFDQRDASFGSCSSLFRECSK